MSKENHFLIEKAKKMAMPEFMLPNHARRILTTVIPKLIKKRSKELKIDYQSITKGNIDEVKKHFSEIIRTEKRIINQTEHVMLDIMVLMERKTNKLIVTFKQVKDKNPQYATQLKECIDAMISLFEKWFARIQAFEKGSRTYITANADVLMHEATHLLWALRYFDSRAEQRIQKKISTDARHYSKDHKTQAKYDKKFEKEVKLLRSKLKPLITHADKLDKDLLESTLLRETEEYEKEINQIIVKLEASGFPKDDMEELKGQDRERKKEFMEFLQHQEHHLNSVIKFDAGQAGITLSMRKDVKEHNEELKLAA